MFWPSVFLICLFLVWNYFSFLRFSNLRLIRDHWQLNFSPFPLPLINSLLWLVYGGRPFLSYLFFYVLFTLWLMVKYGSKLPRLYQIYSLIGFALFLSRQDFHSPIPLGTGRYLLVLFPLFIISGSYLLKSRRSFLIYLTISIFLLVFNYYLFLSNYFVG